MMFFTLRNGCPRTASYIVQNGSDYRLPDTSYLASWATSYLPEPSTWELPKLKPQFVFHKPLDSGKLTFEVIDLREIFTVNEADRKKLEALSRQSIWYSNRAVA
jgi:hypothetical protein